MVAFSQLRDLWAAADGVERVMLAQGLFEYLVIDLDQQQIVDFRLHAWADQYLMLRADLYGGDDDPNGGNDAGGDNNENRSTDVSSDEAILSPNGIPALA